jgi:predicted anti-sigma-YlaC factor YlaD
LAYERLIHWLAQIYATTESEIGCDQLQALLPTYVELEIVGQSPGNHLPQVSAHLAQCPDCAEEYAGLREVVALEAQGYLPEIEEILAQFEAPEPVLEQLEAIPVLAS